MASSPGPAPERSEPSAHLSADDLRRRRRAAVISVVVGVGLLVVKFAAYYVTHSSAVLSDALESIVNVVASSFALFSILLAGKPPDESHPYGHGKVEFFAAGFEGALIIVAAFGILWTAVPKISDPQPIPSLDVGLALLTLAGIINYLLGTYLIRTGRATRSPTLVADGRHLHTDALTSAGVIGGLVLVLLTGWYVLDPLIACLVAVNILRTGRGLLRESAAGLMDESDPDFLDRVAGALEAVRRPGWIWPHHLRARRTGAMRHVDFHLVVPRFWDIRACHEVQQAIEPALLAALGEPGQVLVHFDPCSPGYCPRCDLPDCPVRDAPFVARRAWSTEDVVAGPPYSGAES